MRLPWIICLSGIALAIAMPFIVFGPLMCDTDEQFLLLMAEAALAFASLIATIVQHVRTPQGTSRLGQAIALYILSAGQIFWLPISFIMLAFGSDSC